jgi:hypothetical protein
MKQSSIVIAALFYGQDAVDAIKMNNQQKLEAEQEIDDKMDQEIETQFQYFPESSQKIF